MQLRPTREEYKNSSKPVEFDIQPDYLPPAFKPQIARTRFNILKLVGLGRKPKEQEQQKTPSYAVQIRGDGVSLLADGAERSHFSGDIDAPKAADAARSLVALATLLEEMPVTAKFGQSMKAAMLNAFDTKGMNQKDLTTKNLAARLSTVAIRGGVLAMNALRIRYDRAKPGQLTDGGRAAMNEAFRQAEAFIEAPDKPRTWDEGAIGVLYRHVQTVAVNLPTELAA